MNLAARLALLFALLAAPFCVPSQAADYEVAPSLVCDTQEQVERFVALFAGDAQAAIRVVNAEQKNPTACAMIDGLTGEALARLRALSQQDKQLMAAVNATKSLLERQVAATQRGTSLATPGLVIHIATSPQPPQIDVTPSHVVPSDDARED